MSRTRVTLVTAACVALVLLLQTVVETVLSDIVIVGAIDHQSALPSFALLQVVLASVVRVVAFGLGVWLSLRVIAPVGAVDAWTRVIGRGIIATLLGTAAVALVALLWAILAAVSVSAYPLGYSLDPTINGDSLANTLAGAFSAVFPALIEWFPLVVLATMLLKLWLVAHPVSEAVTVPASRVGTLADR
jgi:hypothetical protein